MPASTPRRRHYIVHLTPVPATGGRCIEKACLLVSILLLDFLYQHGAVFGATFDGLRRERLFKRLLLREKRTSIRHERRRESTADGQRPTSERDG